MTVVRGEVVVIIGPSGCGKVTYTMYKQFLNLYRRLFFWGERVNQPQKAKILSLEIHQKIGHVQITSFFTLPQLWIISYCPLQSAEEEIKEVKRDGRAARKSRIKRKEQQLSTTTRRSKRKFAIVEPYYTGTFAFWRVTATWPQW